MTSSLYPHLPDRAIDGVLVRDTGWLDPAAWEEDDFAYMQAELRAVMLAWLNGLRCPVINRPDASQWYRSGVPLVAWRRQLRSAGLKLPEVVITSEPEEAAAFRRRLETDGADGAVYAPLTNAIELSPRRRRRVETARVRAGAHTGVLDRSARRRPPSPAWSVTT